MTLKGSGGLDLNESAVVATKLAYSISEAVRASGLGRTYLYEKIGSGDLKSRKIGGRRVILRDDLLDFLRNAS